MYHHITSINTEPLTLFAIMYVCLLTCKTTPIIADSVDDEGGPLWKEVEIPSETSSASNSLKNDDTSEGSITQDTPPKPPVTEGSHSSELLYLKLFRQQRISHKEAVETLIALKDYQKQYKMIQMLINKMIKVLTESRLTLMQDGFMPGDPVPNAEHERTRDAFSNTLENTAFFGDLVLRFPDIMHDIMKRTKEGDLAVRWGVSFCQESSIYTDNEAKLLNLMSQELGIIDKSPDYINPYKQNVDKVNKKLKDYERKLGSDPSTAKKKEKKKKEKKRGPRMSGASHSEL